MQDVPGVTPPVVEAIRQTEELHIRLRSDDLAFHGLTRAYVAQILQTALQGEVVSQVLEGQRRFDLLVRLEENYRTGLREPWPAAHRPAEQSRPDRTPRTGRHRRRGRPQRHQSRERPPPHRHPLQHAGPRPRQCRRRNPAASLPCQITLPEGYFIEYGGQFESQQRATTLILTLAAISVVGMFVVLMILYPSVRIVLQILNALPTAFIGGVLALVITQQSLTVASLVGFISLGGIAVRNGILLVTHYFHLMKEEGEAFTPEMVVRGSLERLAPVLMTAL